MEGMMADTTQKSDEQIAKEKAAVEAMRNAKANMESALARISDLEAALRSALDCIKRFKGYTPSTAYIYGGQETIHSEIDKSVAAILKRVG